MNLENKENLSNYQLLKRKPSVCSTSLHFSKLIAVVQFFFPVTPILQWFQLNFGAGNFRGRRPGTSTLRMLRRLTAVLLPISLRPIFNPSTSLLDTRRKTLTGAIPVQLLWIVNSGFMSFMGFARTFMYSFNRYVAVPAVCVFWPFPIFSV